MAYKIQRKSFSVNIVVATDDDEGVSSALALNGILKGIHVTAPNLDDTDTYTVTIKDADGNTIFTRASLAKSITTSIFFDANNRPLELPLSGNHTVTITASGGQAADRAFTGVLLIDRG